MMHPARPYQRVFSYYGGKSRLARHYPPPRYDVVIEPFAGGASYAALYAEHQVWINDRNPKVYAIWRFLTSPTALDWVERDLPRTVERGADILSLLPAECPEGLAYLCQAEASRGSFGTAGIRRIVTPWGAWDWPQVLPRLRYWIPRVAHWHVTHLSYTDLVADVPATWFVDPPYANAAGQLYETHAINYSDLGHWCQTRVGQTIVCENEGATWLPFEPFADRAGCFTGRAHRAKASGREVVYLQER